MVEAEGQAEPPPVTGAFIPTGVKLDAVGESWTRPEEPGGARNGSGPVLNTVSRFRMNSQMRLSNNYAG